MTQFDIKNKGTGVADAALLLLFVVVTVNADDNEIIPMKYIEDDAWRVVGDDAFEADHCKWSDPVKYEGQFYISPNYNETFTIKENPEMQGRNNCMNACKIEPYC